MDAKFSVHGFACLLVGAVVASAGCAGPHARGAPTGGGSAVATAPLRRADAAWLARITYGADAATLAEFRADGRRAFLERQLDPAGEHLPDPVQAQIDALEVQHADPGELLARVQERNRAIRELPAGPERMQARRALAEDGNRFAYQASERRVLRELYSPAQLQEEMVWFWMNHFSVFQGKTAVRWLVGDYEERAIRPHALGHFHELVLATLEHPAMLEYLDNARNAVGHLNENYARELMELHTLGVDAGYSQADVQNLARILTGVGVDTGPARRVRPEWQRLLVRRGAFEFNPARHDFGEKRLLGVTIPGSGFDEVERAVRLITASPACARFIAHKLAVYFVADDPPPALVARMAETFARTDGDIAAVLRVLFTAPELDAAAGKKYKDPTRFLVSSVRLAYDGRTVQNPRPLINWLNALGEGSYSHQTPDGYALTESGWASAGQLSRRFEIARNLGAGNAALFAPDGGPPGVAGGTAGVAGGTVGVAGGGLPQLASPVYYAVLDPWLAQATRAALAKAATQVEWNTFLLASPDWNYF